ncbi:MAG: hypothetical protein QNJ46_28235 [Leptolyngbyaceae cyanobacterium MO_188.B28]|nr:hypothetical protein [Leptolyngbyaceae cyanobacterium MO_188.B28]
MKTLEYLNPRSTQTLLEGIWELRVAEGAEADAAENVAPELVDDIEVHDAIHVLFGCPTNLAGEIIAHVWTLFGTTMSVRDMGRVNMHDDHRQVLAKIGHGRLLKMWFYSVPRIIITLFRALRMKRRWPAEDYRLYLDQRLCDLRKDFGIRLSSPSPTDQRGGGAALRTVRSHSPYIYRLR